MVATLLCPVCSHAVELGQTDLQQPTTQVTACDLLIGPGGEDLAIRRDICLTIAAGELSIMHWPDFTRWRAQARQLYDASAYSPAWLDNGEPTPQALKMTELLESADEKGLQPQDYDGPRWGLRLEKFSSSSERSQARPLSATDLAQFDVALTISAMRYLSDLHQGRANPDAAYGRSGKSFDAAAFLRNNVIRSGDVRSAVAQVEPGYAAYRRTLKALKFYTSLVKEGEDEALPPPAPKVLAPGQTYPGTELLAAKLRRLGDLAEDARLSGPSDLYAGALVEAVKNFQRRHGLTPDGRIGADTFRQLATPLAFRVRQIQLTLERIRWLPSGLKPPLVVVNIPEFQLRAYDDHRVLSMKVIVGKAYSHQTPVFADDLEYVIFRPYWNVPARIVKEEIVPILQKRPDYLVKHQMEVVDRQGTVITASTVDPDTLRQLLAGKLEIRQRPGPQNSLGLVKLVFPNQYDVYLHATPERELFSRTRRDFSHGCIRVEDATALAAWALSSDPSWTRKRIHAAMSGEETLQVNLPRRIPVLIVYGTVVVEDDGEVHFFDDVYGLDDTLAHALAAVHP